MSANETVPAGDNKEASTAQPDREKEPTAASTEEITYHAVEKEGQVTAIWEMQGRKHIRTIDPRSRMGEEILRLYTTEHHEDPSSSGAHASTLPETSSS